MVSLQIIAQQNEWIFIAIRPQFDPSETDALFSSRQHHAQRVKDGGVRYPMSTVRSGRAFLGNFGWSFLLLTFQIFHHSKGVTVS